jgi:hypothetical protein
VIPPCASYSFKRLDEILLRHMPFYKYGIAQNILLGKTII